MCFSCNMDLLLRKITPIYGGGGVGFGKLCQHNFGNFRHSRIMLAL